MNKDKIIHVANLSFKMIYVEGGTFTMGVRGDSYREDITAILRMTLDKWSKRLPISIGCFVINGGEQDA